MNDNFKREDTDVLTPELKGTAAAARKPQGQGHPHIAFADTYSDEKNKGKKSRAHDRRHRIPYKGAGAGKAQGL